MASVINDPNGRRRISFRGLDSKRRSLRLGLVTQAEAATVAGHVETILAAARKGIVLDGCEATDLDRLEDSLHRPAIRAVRWLKDLPNELREKLAAVGLVYGSSSTGKGSKSGRGAGTPPPELGPFLDWFVRSRSDVKPGTRLCYLRSKKHMLEFFGTDRLLESITSGDACEWRRYLLGDAKLADNTVRRHCGMARQFFTVALSHRMISENPFLAKEIKVAVRGNEEKFFFVTRETAAAVLAACPDNEWRLIFALSRFGGLRCPSEHQRLQWGHVLWSEGKLVIPSPKTEHHEGKAQRVMPLFPELLPYLQAAYDEAPPGSEWVIRRHRGLNKNLRTVFVKILLKAGIKPWPKIFHNLRATRQTELSNDYPEHVVSEWLGNCVAIARKHYLHATEDHFAQAAGGLRPVRLTSIPDAQPDAPNTVQSGDQRRTASGAISKNKLENEKPLLSQGSRMGDTGFEPVASTV